MPLALQGLSLNISRVSGQVLVEVRVPGVGLLAAQRKTLRAAMLALADLLSEKTGEA
jgi:hypothetical protein